MLRGKTATVLVFVSSSPEFIWVFTSSCISGKTKPYFSDQNPSISGWRMQQVEWIFSRNFLTLFWCMSVRGGGVVLMGYRSKEEGEHSEMD